MKLGKEKIRYMKNTMGNINPYAIADGGELNEQMFYTASGLAVPKSRVVELDKNNLVAMWKLKK